jgi:[ribosomal protein S5]-alanine N-acetyltransferase
MKVDFNSLIARTKRLIIKPTDFSDYVFLKNGLDLQLLQQSKFDDEEISLAKLFTEEYCKESIIKLNDRANKDESYFFRSYKKDTSEYVGSVIIKTIVRRNIQIAEIGYWILNHSWGNGFGSEMIQGVIDIGFKRLGFHRIEAYINMDNLISMRTAESVGMIKEGIREKYFLENGVWEDHIVYVAISEYFNND